MPDWSDWSTYARGFVIYLAAVLTIATMITIYRG